MNLEKTRFATQAWLEMVGNEIAAAIRNTPPDENFSASLVERYHGAPPLENGAMFGFRVDVEGQTATFRAGVTPDEKADVVIDGDFDALRELTFMATYDPDFPGAVARLNASGKLRARGSIESLGAWFGTLHDRIYDRTE